MKECKMKAVNNQLQLKEEVYMHMMENNVTSINTQSDEKAAYCFLLCKAVSITACLEYAVYLLVIYFQLLKKFQENV